MNNEILIGVISGLVVITLILFLELRKIKKTKPPPPTESPAIYDDLIQEKKRTIEELDEKRVYLSKEVQEFRAKYNKVTNDLMSGQRYLDRLTDQQTSLEEEIEILLGKQEEVEGKIVFKDRELKDLVINIQSIITEQKRKALEDTFYTLHISEDIQNRIIEITNFAARFPEIQNAVASVIYNHFFAAEVASLCNRVLGQGKRVTGIYKITNIKNGMVYVGRSVDIRNRWTQHIKRAVGTEKETQNLLYPAMREHKVWNFSFEVLEECDRDSLNEREKFYQDVYKAKEDYSIK